MNIVKSALNYRRLLLESLLAFLVTAGLSLEGAVVHNWHGVNHELGFTLDWASTLQDCMMFGIAAIITWLALGWISDNILNRHASELKTVDPTSPHAQQLLAGDAKDALIKDFYRAYTQLKRLPWIVTWTTAALVTLSVLTQKLSSPWDQSVLFGYTPSFYLWSFALTTGLAIMPIAIKCVELRQDLVRWLRDAGAPLEKVQSSR